jgi:hypothetical protein
MPLQQTNQLCDITRWDGTLGTAGVSFFLTEDYASAHFPSVTGTTTGRWTHIGLFDVSVDIRDAYQPGASFADGFGSTFDTVYVPNHASLTKVPYQVVFVERLGRGTAQDMKRVYLQRGVPGWPTASL